MPGSRKCGKAASQGNKLFCEWIWRGKWKSR